MSIAIIAPTRNGQIWADEFHLLDSNLKVEVYPDIENPEEVECAVLWLHPYGCLENFPNLKLICSMGAGADHMLNDPGLPNVPLTRIVSDTIATSMSNYVIMAILQYHRRMEKYEQDQKDKVWDQDTFPEREVHVGIAGLGELGTDLAKKLVMLGIKVSGLSNTRKMIESVRSYITSESQLFYDEINVLVCLLPMTKDTYGYLNKALFSRLKNPCYLISVGRGFQQNEADILEALEEGKLTGAFLDVFENEPLPQSSPLWRHPKIKLTPHIASITNPKAAVPIIYENYQRMKRGDKLQHVVDKERGY